MKSQRTLFTILGLFLTVLIIFSCSKDNKEEEDPVIEATGITLDKTSLEMLTNQSESLTFSISPLNVSETEVTWASSNKDVATVSQEGIVNAKAPGEAVISVSTVNGKSDQCEIKVMNGFIDQTSLVLSKGDKETLVGTFASNIKNMTWTSSNESIATVNQEGEVEAIATGEAKIYIIFDDNGVTDSVYCDVFVEGLYMNEKAMELSIDDTKTLSYSLFVIEDNVSWSSNNENVATVTQDGLVTAVGSGKVVITVTSADGDYSDQCNIDIFGELSDADGNKYKTITIGNQTWMAENLATTKYNDGSYIPIERDDSRWSSLSSPAYCWYGGSEEYKEIHGALYNWYAVETGKLCPTGWHVPSYDDMKQFMQNLGISDQEIVKGWIGTVEGRDLKTAGNWKSRNGTNLYLFNAVGSGLRNSSLGYFSYLEMDGYIWSGTEDADNNSRVWRIYLSYSMNSINWDSSYKKYGMSVRCIKNQ